MSFRFSAGPVCVEFAPRWALLKAGRFALYRDTALGWTFTNMDA